MTSSAPKHVLLIGCGNIGLRHLQAVTSLQQSLDITVIEPNTDNRTKAQAGLGELPPHIAVHFSPDWQEAPKEVDLAIIATPARPRRQVVETLLERTTPKWLFLEKVVFVTHRDFDEMIEILEKRGIHTAVNYGRRGYAGYDALRKQLAGKENLSLSVTGSNWNLASNSIHYIDLAVNLFDGLPVTLNGDALTPEDSKHGGYVEFTGTLTGQCRNGGNISLTSLPEAGHPLTVEIANNQERWVIEETHRRITHSRGEDVISTEAFETPFVSQMGYLYDEMLFENKSRMPTLALAAQEHRPLIDAFRARLGQSQEEDTPCPIT